jgi:hypothetical protein
MRSADTRGAKVRAYGALCAWVLLGLLPVPWFVNRFHDDVFVQGEAPWYRIDAVGWLHDHVGLSVMAQLWLLPLVGVAIVLIVAGALEGAAYGLRVDRRDDAWSSLGWAIRSWPAWLLWVAGAVLLVAAGAWIANHLSPSWQWLALVVFVTPLACVPFLGLSLRNLSPTRPAILWHPAWPGWKSVAVLVACLAALALFDQATGLIDVEPLTARMRILVILASLIAQLLLTLVIATACAISWLNCSRLPVRETFAAAVRPGVLGPVVLQQLRLQLLTATLLLPVVALAALLVLVVPQVEQSWRQYGTSLPLVWQWWVRASRFLVAWWWALAQMLASLGPIGLGWFATVGVGRLLVQLGLAEPTPHVAST